MDYNSEEFINAVKNIIKNELLNLSKEAIARREYYASISNNIFWDKHIYFYFFFLLLYIILKTQKQIINTKIRSI